ncbi:MAG: EAL domain-containing protein [Leptolyngbyaceae bacterium]|nr:EAL domain-containing protein [Leptolyngbyaceae bacterium]
MAIHQAKTSNLFIALAVALVPSSILLAAGLYNCSPVQANTLKAQAIAPQFSVNEVKHHPQSHLPGIYHLPGMYHPVFEAQAIATVQNTDQSFPVATDKNHLSPNALGLRHALLNFTGVLGVCLGFSLVLLRQADLQKKKIHQLKQESRLLALEIAQRQQLEATLRQAEEKYRGMFEHSTQGIFQISPDGQYISANPALAHIYGYDSPQDLIATLARGEHQLYVNPQHQQEFVAAIAQQGCVTHFEAPIHRKDGEIIWISENARAVYDANQVLIGYEGTVTDVTERKRTEARLRQYAFYDVLTGLPNQTLFLERVGRAIHQAKLDENRLFAVLHVDLDRFHQIKYSFGYQVAEQLLVASVDRLVSCLPPSTLIARVGADDFAILLEAIPNPDYATDLADHIHQAFTTPFNLKGRDVFTTASLGLAFSSIGYEYPEDFLQAADIAMHQSKILDLPHPLVFTTTMQTEAIARLQLDTDLRQALKRQEFQLYYQPIVSLANHQIIGLEALVRWQNKLQGVISPAEFIALAETTRLIIPLGNWVLREACRQLQIWQRMFANPALFVSVNVSPIQLAQPDFLDQVDQALQEHNLAPSSLKLEITEGAVMENTRWVTEKLEQLKARQIQLCIDDFGTGYSSLSYLHSFPFDTLKIDRCFITCLSKDDNSLEIVRTIIMLAQTLGMDLVAEGIETGEQLAHLKTLPCQYGQGYLFSKPLDSSAVERLIKQKSQGLNNVTAIDYYSRLRG